MKNQRFFNRQICAAAQIRGLWQYVGLVYETPDVTLFAASAIEINLIEDYKFCIRNVPTQSKATGVKPQVT